MRYQLTPEIEKKVVQYVMAGGYAWLAAEAAGVPRSVFEKWLDMGRRSCRQPFRRFYLAVLQAQAQARLSAEIEVRQKDPLSWLRYGPGREEPGQQGWTNAVPAAKQPRDDANEGLPLQVLGDFLQVMLHALEPFPQARVAVVESVEQWKQTQVKVKEKQKQAKLPPRNKNNGWHLWN